jgi:NAD(P)-dependent dehydrogenase (short-subunit alcohol dehydrogenase family)
MSLYAMLSSKGPSGFGHASTAEDVTDGVSLRGKTMLVTGCNSGLGLETMRVLSKRGAHVAAAARTQEKAAQAAASVGANVMPIACDLSEPASVRAAIDTLTSAGTRLDAIICNAGIMALPRLKQSHGYELQFFTNHIGHFILVTGLLERLADNGRVVMLSSSAHKTAPKEGIQFDNLSGQKRYNPWTAYGQSKLANLLFAKALAKRLAGTGKIANALHPGVIKTNLMRYMNIPGGAAGQLGLGVASALFFKTVAQGAATQCYVAANPKAAAISGEYFADCNVAIPRADANDAALAERLWQESERIAARV